MFDYQRVTWKKKSERPDTCGAQTSAAGRQKTLRCADLRFQSPRNIMVVIAPPETEQNN